jgi:hypothetical protein
MGLVDLRGRTQSRYPEINGGGCECLLQLTPGCRLQSLRSFRPTLGLSRRLPGAANAAPALRVRQPEAVMRKTIND